MTVRTLLPILLILIPVTALSDKIAVIGTGDVAGALGPAFAKQGHRIIYGSRNPESSKAQRLVQETGAGASVESPAEAVAKAEIVVLAVPGLLVADIVSGLGDLADKIVIDPTNPLKRKLLIFEHGVETSNAQIIQKLAPEALVVKAFNTLSWKTMAEPETAGGTVSVPIAGNSKRAKAIVADLIEGMGLEPIDVGGVENARWVEGMLILWINNRFSTRDAFDFHLRRLP
jgi:NADPH-dependent F420 reductase